MDDPDLRMCVLFPEEIKRWLELCDAILARNPRFPLPADWMGMDNGEMDRAVRTVLAALGAMRTMTLGDPRLVSFIG